jgi:hypothetical protein
MKKEKLTEEFMKLRWKFAGGIVLMTIIALGAQETMIQSKAAAQNSEDTTLLQIAFRKGVDFYPYAGQVVKPGDGPRYPYAVYKAGTPMFQVDPAWPKFPERNWVLGDVPGVAVDSQGNVWMIHRPKTLNGQGEGNGKGILADLKPPQADCCIPAPPIMEFDAAGNFVQGWGGPGQGFEWPQSEHSIFVDYKGNVWISGNGAKDNQILEFTKDGKFLMQIGHSGKSQGSLDTENFNKPSGIYVYQKTNEVFVSDGYLNKRVIVFDADTGAFKRMWGAYGNKPDDSIGPSNAEGPTPADVEPPALQQFNTVHCVRISNDGLVYVCDRTHNRLQVFKPDGTYVSEVFIARESTGGGTLDGVAFSSDREQKFMYIADSTDQHIWILDRKTLQIQGRFVVQGHYAGQGWHMHGIASDSNGNIYVAEGILGHRVDKFVYKGLSTSASE